MIFSVFVTGNSASEQVQSDMLEYYWSKSGQAGELVRLIAAPPGTEKPLHALARVDVTLPWADHPYIDDVYPGYDLPASLLQWLWQEQLDATILLLDAGSIPLQGMDREVSPGKAVAHAWDNFPRGDGPFGLSSAYQNLQGYCVNRELPLEAVQLPLLIHSSDLLQLTPRWLELTGILRQTVDENAGPPGTSLKIALAIAAAEHQVTFRVEDLSGHVLAAEDGGRDFLARCEEFEAARSSGDFLAYLLPIRRPGALQGRVLDQVYLDTGSKDLKKLNLSAAAIWDLCDGQRNLLEIARILQARYDIPLETMAADVLQGVKLMRNEGALGLESVI